MLGGSSSLGKGLEEAERFNGLISASDTVTHQGVEIFEPWGDFRICEEDPQFPCLFLEYCSSGNLLVLHCEGILRPTQRLQELRTSIYSGMLELR